MDKRKATKSSKARASSVKTGTPVGVPVDGVLIDPADKFFKKNFKKGKEFSGGGDEKETKENLVEESKVQLLREVEVVDDGTGFDDGFSNMKSRIEKFFGNDKEFIEKNELREWIKEQKKKMSSSMNDKDLRYAQALGDNPTDREKALIVAGFSYEEVKRVGSEIDGRVNGYLKLLQLEGDIELNMTKVDIMKMWGQIGMDEKERAADRLRATELIAKAKGMFVEHEEGKRPVIALLASDKLQRLASLAYDQWLRVKTTAIDAKVGFDSKVGEVAVGTSA